MMEEGEKENICLNVNNNKINDSKQKIEIKCEDKIKQINANLDKDKDIECVEDKTINLLPFSLTNNDFNFDLKYNASLKQILPVGLKNLGKSCFMNSCLQCFYHCSKFTSELLENYQKYEKMKGPVLLSYLEALKILYTNGKNSSKRQIMILYGNNDNEYGYECCGCKKRKFKENKDIYHYIETNPASAEKLYSYILENYSNLLLFKGGSDPKIVAEMILSTMNKEINSNFKYIRSREIPKDNENLLFNHIFNYYQNNKTIISSNFYWIKERVSICSECGKETYNFQSDYILYFYPEAIINGLNLKIDNNEYKYKLSLENCFEYFHISEQLDINLFTCTLCNKRVKAKSILYYMSTLPKYLVLCLCKDKDEPNPIKYILSYNQEIDLAKYYRKHSENNYSTKYKFHCGCYSRNDYFHMIALCVHFDGLIYEFNDSYYKENNFFNSSENAFYDIPYLLIFKRSD